MTIPLTSAIGSLQTPMLDQASSVAGDSGSGVVGGFADLLRGKLDSLNAEQALGDKASQDMATNRVEDVAQAMLHVEKANVSLQFATQVRNKAIEAYQDILRMSI